MLRAAVLAAFFVAVSFAEESAPEVAFGEDDECLAGEGGESCALNAVQLRAKQLQEEEQRREREAEPVGIADARRTNETLVLLSGEAPKFDATCFAFTGGTCLAGGCDASRNAECISGKCVCAGCAGADGVCYKKQNKEVAKGFVLRNAKYEHYKMYFQRMSTFGQLSTTRLSTWMNMEQDKFNLYEIPAKSKEGFTEYFLVSAKWPDYVVGMKATTGTAISPFAAYAVNLENKASVLDVWGPDNVMMRVCQMPETSSYSGAIQVGASLTGGTTIWAYIHHGSWLVYGSVSSPGPGGLWIPDPPIPKGILPNCPQ